MRLSLGWVGGGALTGGGGGAGALYNGQGVGVEGVEGEDRPLFSWRRQGTSLREIIVNSYRAHGLKFDCNQSTTPVQGARPLIDFN